VERRTELMHFTDEGGRVTARLGGLDGREEDCQVHYIAGCDGAGSIVREILGTGYPGGTYRQIFYVADVVMTIKGYAAPEVGNAYARSLDLCRQAGETPQLFSVLAGLTGFNMIPGGNTDGARTGRAGPAVGPETTNSSASPSRSLWDGGDLGVSRRVARVANTPGASNYARRTAEAPAAHS